jgi:uncharacterized membrane protein YadS
VAAVVVAAGVAGVSGYSALSSWNHWAALAFGFYVGGSLS